MTKKKIHNTKAELTFEDSLMSGRQKASAVVQTKPKCPIFEMYLNASYQSNDIDFNRNIIINLIKIELKSRD